MRPFAVCVRVCMRNYGGAGATRLLTLCYWTVFFFFAEKVTHLFGRSQTVLEGE